MEEKTANPKTCKFNEATVLDTATVRAAVRETRAARLQADWTLRDPRVTEALAAFGRSSVRLYVVSAPRPGSVPEVLPTLVIPGLVGLSRLEMQARPLVGLARAPEVSPLGALLGFLPRILADHSS